MTATCAPLSTGGLLIEALAGRDFAGMTACLAPDVRFRALLPRGLVEVTGADDTVDRFRTWFGGPDTLQILDAALGEIGPRLYARWRVRLTAPEGAVRTIEQHVFAIGAARLATLDLVCSGFIAD